MTTKREPLEQATQEVRDVFSFVRGFVKGPLREVQRGIRDIVREASGELPMPEPDAHPLPRPPAAPRVVEVCGTCGGSGRIARVASGRADLIGQPFPCPTCQAR